MEVNNKNYFASLLFLLLVFTGLAGAQPQITLVNVLSSGQIPRIMLVPHDFFNDEGMLLLDTSSIINTTSGERRDFPVMSAIKINSKNVILGRCGEGERTSIFNPPDYVGQEIFRAPSRVPENILRDFGLDPDDADYVWSGFVMCDLNTQDFVFSMVINGVINPLGNRIVVSRSGIFKRNIATGAYSTIAVDAGPTSAGFRVNDAGQVAVMRDVRVGLHVYPGGRLARIPGGAFIGPANKFRFNNNGKVLALSSTNYGEIYVSSPDGVPVRVAPPSPISPNYVPSTVGYEIGNDKMDINDNDAVVFQGSKYEPSPPNFSAVFFATPGADGNYSIVELFKVGGSRPGLPPANFYEVETISGEIMRVEFLGIYMLEINNLDKIAVIAAYRQENGTIGSGVFLVDTTPKCGEKPNQAIPNTYIRESIDGSFKWQFNPEVVDSQGLVLRNIKANDELLFESISVPRFEVHANNTLLPTFVDFDKAKDKFIDGKWNRKVDAVKGIDTIKWSFRREFKEPYLKGFLCINYEIVVRWKKVDTCEITNRDCYRFIPKVSFTWTDRGSTPHDKNAQLRFFRARYKLDYGKVGLTLTSDEDDISGFLRHNYGDQDIVTTEKHALVTLPIMKGDFDNIHNALPLPGKKTVTIPGCRDTAFDCVHMHWRWSGVTTRFLLDHFPVDPLIEPSDDSRFNEIYRAALYLVPNQRIDLYIVKDKPGEDKLDPTLRLVNGEVIATTAGKSTMLSTAEDSVVWYESLVENSAGDTFFRHGFFVLGRG